MGRHSELVRWYRGDPSQRAVIPGKKQIVVLGKGSTSSPFVPAASALVTTGSNSGVLSTPTTAALNSAMASPWEIRILMAAANWVCGAVNDYVSGQIGSSGFTGAAWYIYRGATTRQIALGLVNAGGGAGPSAGANTPAGWAAGSLHWVRVTWNGSTNISWYWSDDGSTWT